MLPAPPSYPQAPCRLSVKDAVGEASCSLTDRRNGAIVAPGSSPSVSDETVNELKLKISELRLSGLSKEEILDLCSKLYEEGQK